MKPVSGPARRLAMSALDVGFRGSGMSGAWSMNCSCILDTPAIHGGRTRTSSLHMDVRSLAVPEHLYPAASVTYEALSNITYEELTQSTSIETNI